MIPDIDIWRAAELMARRYGDEAAQEAEQRAGELEKAGDAEGQAIWLRIAGAVRELQRGLAEGEAVN